MLSKRERHINFEIKSSLPEFVRQQIKFNKRDIFPVFYTGCDFFEISVPGSYAVWVKAQPYFCSWSIQNRYQSAQTVSVSMGVQMANRLIISRMVIPFVWAGADFRFF